MAMITYMVIRDGEIRPEKYPKQKNTTIGYSIIMNL